MNRRAFLSRIALAAPALILGDAALEAFERLTHQRKSFPNAKNFRKATIRATTIQDAHLRNWVADPLQVNRLIVSQGVYNDLLKQYARERGVFR